MNKSKMIPVTEYGHHHCDHIKRTYHLVEVIESKGLVSAVSTNLNAIYEMLVDTHPQAHSPRLKRQNGMYKLVAMV